MKTQRDFIVRQQDGRYKVYDKQGHYRQSFATAAAADEYIKQQEQKTPRRGRRAMLAVAAAGGSGITPPLLKRTR